MVSYSSSRQMRGLCVAFLFCFCQWRGSCTDQEKMAAPHVPTKSQLMYRDDGFGTSAPRITTQSGGVPEFAWRESGKPLWKTTLEKPPSVHLTEIQTLIFPISTV
ncbi:unnamed protein product [Timema podura]|uniref:Secreted protein n=1 Tax=Timema podura TaxID=61482 RepID=A0ABN7PBN9_TIMPD|nr:unnamed protein product [Timema podura]